MAIARGTQVGSEGVKAANNLRGEAIDELYPNVVDGPEEEGGVPSRLLKTDRRKAEKEGTPCKMFAGSPSGRTTRSRSRWTTSPERVRVA
jgi:hypothetical protein